MQSHRNVRQLCACLLIGAALLAPLVPLAGASPSPAPGITGTDSLMVRTHPALTMAYDPWGELLWAAFVGGGVMAMSLDGSSRWVITNVDGLPSNTVYAIAPTPDRVWLGTAGGLAAWHRADSTIEAGFKVQDGLALDDKVWALFREGDSIWVGTDRDGLFLLENAAGRLKPVLNPLNDSRFEHPVRGIAADPHEIWISATGYGVVRWDRASGHSGRWEEPFKLFHNETLNGEVHMVGADVWVATHGEGVSRFNRTSGYWQTFANPDNLGGYTVNQMSLLGKEVWFAVDTGIARYSYTTDKWTHWDGEDGFPSYQATAVAIGGGQVFADALFEGIAVYDRPADLWSVLEWEGHDQQPPYNIVGDCAVDGPDLIFATWGGGAARYDPAAGVWTHSYKAGRPGLPDIAVHRVLPGATDIWFGTEAGPARFDRSTGAWSSYRTDGLASYARVGAPAFDLAKSPDGTVWAGTKEQGLATYDESADRFQTYGTGNGLSGQRVWAVSAHGPEVWVGTDYGLDRFDPATSQATRFWPLDRDEPVFDLAWDGTVMWIAARTGLYKLDPATGAVAATGVAQTVVMRVLPSPDGVFVATYQDGVQRVDAATGHVRGHYTIEDAARFDIKCLALHDGILYVGSAWGVERLHLATERWLPQQGVAAALLAAPPPPTLDIDQPTDGQRIRIGDALTLRGSAQGLPERAVLEARLGVHEWVSLGAGPGFSATFETQHEPEGTQSVLVRAVHEGRVVASTAARIQLAWSGAASSDQELAAGSASALGPDGRPVQVRHLPPMEADEGDEVRFTVTTTPPLTGATTRLVFDGAEPALGFIDQGDGSYHATAGPFPAGTALSYHIEVAWDGGSVHLPAPGDPAGESYPLFVRYAYGFVELFAPPDALRFEAAIGRTTSFQIPIQNVGTRPADLSLAWGGRVPNWLDTPPTDLHVDAGSTAYVQANLTVPSGLKAHTTGLELSLRQGTLRQDFPIEIGVGMAAGALGEGDGVPGPGFAALVAFVCALAAAMQVARRRRES